MDWYYALNQQQYGPVSEDEIHRLAQQGVIQSNSLVWRQGMAGWVAYAQAFAPIAPAMPVAASPAAAPAPMSRLEGLEAEHRMEGTGGNTANAVLRQRAKDALSGHWFMTAMHLLVVGLVAMLICFIPLGSILGMGAVFLGITGYMLGIARGGYYVELGTMFKGFEHFVQAMVLYLITTLIYVAVVGVMMIPYIGMFMAQVATNDRTDLNPDAALGLVAVGMFYMVLVWLVMSYLQARLGLAFYYLWDDPFTGAIGALSNAWNATKGRSIKLFRMYLYFGFLSVLVYIGIVAIVGTLGMILGEEAALVLMLLSFPIFIGAFLLLIPYMFVSIAFFYEDIQEQPA